MASTTEPAAAPEKRGGNLLLVILLVLQLVLMAAVIMLYLRPAPNAAAAGAEVAEAETARPAGPAIYHALDPAFIVNLQDDRRLRFMQISVEVMTRDPRSAKLIENNVPMLRDALLMLFSAQRLDEIETAEGKEALRSAALETVRDILLRESPEASVEAIFFTSFVVQ
ncbi:MAG TPA: flagellar basal body-associated FliL family protein [Gammaproteobacteria bacterium]|nr:flagellar basal body-associated FliL family protein [Gammaproteobacteria bacterium]